MAIRTSAIFYGRGIPRNNNNFAFVAQTNNTVVTPLSRYLSRYSFYNRNIVNLRARGARYPWNN